MNRFSLLDIKDIDLKTWQQVAITYPNQAIQSKHISLARLADITGRRTIPGTQEFQMSVLSL